MINLGHYLTMLISLINVRDMEMVYSDVHLSKSRGRRYTRVKPMLVWRKLGNQEQRKRNVSVQQRYVSVAHVWSS
jgi:hypothetical protein